MKRILGFAGLVATFAASPLFAGNNSTLNVVVQNPSGQAIAGARITAVFNNASGHPDPVATQISTTDATGTANFSGTGNNALTDGDFYTVLVASQNFGPSLIQQQFNAPGFTAAPSVSTPTITVVLSSTSFNKPLCAQVSVSVTGAQANTSVFCAVELQAGNTWLATGFGRADGSGSATVPVVNVASGTAGYNVVCYSPFTNGCISVQVGALACGTTSGGPLSLANAPAPVSNVGQQNGGNLSVDAVVIDTQVPPNPIPFTNLNFQGRTPADQFGNTINDFRGAFTDQNGRFQLYGLNPGTTYYASIFQACNPNTGLCYQGFQSTASFGAPPGPNDFLFVSSATPILKQYKLNQLSGGSGTMAVYLKVKDASGNLFPMPQGGLSLWPDGAAWTTGGSCAGPKVNNPGFASLNTNATTGYFLVTNLMSGNYQLSECSGFGCYLYNDGPDANFNSGPQNNYGQCPGDDLRVTIDTTTPSADVYVFDSAGNLKMNGSSITIVVPLPNISLAGRVQGTLTLPSSGIDLSQHPISITLNPQCTSNCNGSGGGFFVFGSSNSGPSLSYSIPVSTGQTYWFNFTSDYWGAVFPGGNQVQPDLTSTGTVVVNLTAAPAGRVLGHLLKPDGSTYIQPQNGTGGGGGVNIQAEGGNSWGWTQLLPDGSFVLGGLLPAAYTLNVQSFGGSFPFTVKLPAPVVNVAANQDLTQDITLAPSVTVDPKVVPSTAATLPPLSIVNCGQNNFGDCPPETWDVFAFPQGTPLNSKNVIPFLAKTGQTPGLFEFSPSTGQVNGHCGGQFHDVPRFCYGSLAADPNNGTSYDFYLVRKGDFDQGNLGGGARPYFVIESQALNKLVQLNKQTSPIFSPFGGPGGSTTTVEDIDVTPNPVLTSVPQAVLVGTVTTSNFITQQQFKALGGNFSRFLQYLPQVFLYDSTGTLNAVGLVTPFPPAVTPLLNAQLMQSVGAGDFASFLSLMNPSTGWGAVGYEIRGLTAGKTYNLVITSPNYPPYKTTVTLGAAGSYTRQDVNLDSNPGSTLSGIVQSTATTPVAIANAQVTIQAPGFTAQTVASDSNGNWQIAGLGAGQYKVSVAAPGYVQGAQLVVVNGVSAVTAPAFQLTAAGASISGRVFTTNPICLPNNPACLPFVQTSLKDAVILAYDDTVNSSNPGALLPLYRAVTNSSGIYRLDGLQVGDSYKIFVNAHGPNGRGYFVVNQTTTAVSGLRSGVDFQLNPKDLTINLSAHPTATTYEFDVTNYQEFSSGDAWIGPSPFSKANSTDIAANPGFCPGGFVQSPGNKLVLNCPLSAFAPGVTYVIHGEAQPSNPLLPLVIREVSFGIGLPHSVCQNVDEALLGDDSATNEQGVPLNQAALDASGVNPSGISLAAGALIPIVSTTVPSMCMTETTVSTSTILGSAFRTAGISIGSYAGAIFNVTLSSINYTSKGVDLTFAYSQSGTSFNDLAIYAFQGGQWVPVPGTQTIDPVRGTITVKRVKSLSSVLGLPKGHPMQALSDGRGYRPNSAALAALAASGLRPDDSGIFAILRPSLAGGNFSGTTIKIYNFPNPFNLSQKTVTVNTTGPCGNPGFSSVNTNGTVVKAELPPGVSGSGNLRIYTVAGELVKEMDQGQMTGGQCYYINWDGKNKSGVNVANGVYYGILSVPGVKVKDATFKLAVIK